MELLKIALIDIYDSLYFSHDYIKCEIKRPFLITLHFFIQFNGTSQRNV